MTQIPTAYDTGVQAARARLFEGRWGRRVLQRDFTPEQTEAFLLVFLAQGIAMTKPVDGWIRRA